MKISEIAPPGREKQVKTLKKKFDDPGAPYAIAWAQHNKHGKPKKKESIGSSEYSEVKAILDKHGIKSSDDVELGSAVYDELFDYFANSGEMPYGVMKARTGMPDEWIADRLDDLGLVTEGDLNAWYAEQYAKELAEKEGKIWSKMKYGEQEAYRKIANKKYGVVKSEGEDVPTQKGRDAKLNVLTPRAMNVVKKQIKKDANKQRRADSKKAVDTDESTNQVAGIGHQGLNFKFKVSDLINHAKQYPVKQVDPNIFKAQLANRQEDPTKSGQRAANADLSHPIIVVKFGDGSLMVADGTHRVQKAISLQQKINARIIPVNDMQKFRVASLSDNPTQSTQQKGKQPKADTSAGAADSTPTIAQAFRKGMSGESVEEAPFGSAVKSAIGRAVNRAGTKVKKAVGSVPGLGDLKTSAQAQQNIMQIADKTWQEFLQYKQSNPTDDQMTKWFKDRGMEIDSPDQANKDTVIQGVKAGIAQAGGGPAKASQDQTQQKDKFNLSQLQKIEPTATPKTIRAIAQAKAGKTVQGELAVAMQPLMTKFANALQNPTKRQRLAVALAESLSQSDLSKLDMLAREGMVPKNKVARFKTAMRTLAKGKDLPISYKDDVIDVVTKLAKIITKPSVMGMIRKGLKEEHKQTAQEKFRTWVNQAENF